MYKKQGLPIDAMFHLYTFYTHIIIDSRPMFHRTFHTEQSSVYEKQETSIYLYTSFGYSTKPFSCKFIN
jgi:hypothetical protein